MRIAAILVLIVTLAACGRSPSEAGAAAEDAGRAAAGARPEPMEPVTIDRIRPRGGAALEVASPAVGPDHVIAARQSGYGANRSLPVRWTATAGARSYAVVVEDPDAPGRTPFVHWLIWNIPADLTSLPEGLPNTATLSTPQGARQGHNDAGSYGYFGPRPPPGPAHRYHIQVFALDAPLAAAPGAELADVTEAMKDHVVAAGELVGAFKAPARP